MTFVYVKLKEENPKHLDSLLGHLWNQRVAHRILGYGFVKIDESYLSNLKNLGYALEVLNSEALNNLLRDETYRKTHIAMFEAYFKDLYSNKKLAEERKSGRIYERCPTD